MARTYYLRVRNWERFQHYKTRQDGWRPTWVKLYVDLPGDDKFAELSTAAKWLFIGMLIKAAKTNNLIPSKPQWLSNRLSMPEQELRKALPELLKFGFVERVESREALESSLDDVLAREEKIRVEEIRKENKNPLASPFKIPPPRSEEAA